MNNSKLSLIVWCAFLLGATPFSFSQSCNDNIPRDCSNRKLEHKIGSCFCFSCVGSDEQKIPYCVSQGDLKINNAHTDPKGNELIELHWRIIERHFDDGEPGGFDPGKIAPLHREPRIEPRGGNAIKKSGEIKIEEESVIPPGKE